MNLWIDRIYNPPFEEVIFLILSPVDGWESYLLRDRSDEGGAY